MRYPLLGFAGGFACAAHKHGLAALKSVQSPCSDLPLQMIDSQRLEEIVREAGRIAYASWPGEGHVVESWEKHPGSPVSAADIAVRSEEHTSELQSLMRIPYAVFGLKKQT